jgi:hypothetical protein
VRTGVEDAGAHLEAMYLGCFPRSGVCNKLGLLQKLSALSLSLVVGGPIMLQPGLKATCGELTIVEVHSFCAASEQGKHELNNEWARTSFQGFVLARCEWGGQVVARRKNEIQRF